MNDTRYLYEVRPVKPIIISGKSLRVPCSVQLTKEEVLEYMKSATIYRRFAASEPIRVTGENIDVVHQQTYNPNYKSVISVPTISIPKVEVPVVSVVTQKPEKIDEDPIVPDHKEDEEDTEKKLKEEESSVISSDISEDQKVAEETATNGEEKPEEKHSSSDVVSDETETPTEVVAKSEVEQPAQTSVPSINLKGNNNGKNNNHSNNKNNYKK